MGLSSLIICSSTRAFGVRLTPVTPDTTQRIDILRGYTPGGTLLMVANSSITLWAEYLKGQLRESGTDFLVSRWIMKGLSHSYEVNHNRIFNPNFTTTPNPLQIPTQSGHSPRHSPSSNTPSTEPIILSPIRWWGARASRALFDCP